MDSTHNRTSEISAKRYEVVQHMESFVGTQLGSLLKPVEQSWQPSDFLPDASSEDFYDQLRTMRVETEALPDELLVVLVGDMITEEALPTYQTWLNRLHGLTDETGMSDRPWAQWSRGWTAEENRHGDLLNRYLYLSGRVDMRAVETTIHHLIKEGFDPKTQNDPYLGFVYTAFQERATKISHRNVARLAQKVGDERLCTICGLIAGDEARHESAYKLFMGKVFELDPGGALEAFETMMRRKIVMPAVAMHDGNDRQLFRKFSKLAQRTGVYTVQDYGEIISHLVRHWGIGNLAGISGAAARAQDYLCTLADRYAQLAGRAVLDGKLAFSWVHGREVG
jgi:acyl-[acyl-carrier-protein] desaturase